MWHEPTLRDDGLAAVAAAAIRVECARRDLSQRDLAELLLRSRAAISQRFSGVVPWSLDDVGRIALALGCPITDLVAPRHRTASAR